mmetsp:Transcript_10017/g.11963  ORF Transcript_10017/g.11963 Transcript_10017/m.11963 type:complete len:214 (+) Transcript_10017:293-934(+)
MHCVDRTKPFIDSAVMLTPKPLDSPPALPLQWSVWMYTSGMKRFRMPLAEVTMRFANCGEHLHTYDVPRNRFIFPGSSSDTGLRALIIGIQTLTFPPPFGATPRTSTFIETFSSTPKCRISPAVTFRMVSIQRSFELSVTPVSVISVGFFPNMEISNKGSKKYPIPRDVGHSCFNSNPPSMAPGLYLSFVPVSLMEIELPELTRSTICKNDAS